MESNRVEATVIGQRLMSSFDHQNGYPSRCLGRALHVVSAAIRGPACGYVDSTCCKNEVLRLHFPNNSLESPWFITQQWHGRDGVTFRIRVEAFTPSWLGSQSWIWSVKRRPVWPKSSNLVVNPLASFGYDVWHEELVRLQCSRYFLWDKFQWFWLMKHRVVVVTSSLLHLYPRMFGRYSISSFFTEQCTCMWHTPW